jgi:hypothetical protein
MQIMLILKLERETQLLNEYIFRHRPPQNKIRRTQILPEIRENIL